MRCGWSYKGDLAERRKEDEMKATCIGKIQGRCLEANRGEERRSGSDRACSALPSLSLSLSLCPVTKDPGRTCDRVLS